MKIKYKLQGAYNKLRTFYYTKKYPDYKDDEYNIGEFKFIWGVRSWDDLSRAASPNLYTMNDIEIDYNRKTKLYSLGVETAYMFEDGKIGEMQYLESLLKAFTEFMSDNGYNTNEPHLFFMCDPDIKMEAESIPELYTNFRLFVEGYKALYGGKN